MSILPSITTRMFMNNINVLNTFETKLYAHCSVHKIIVELFF